MLCENLWPVQVDVWRGPLVESRHLVSACAVDLTGKTLFEIGNVEEPTFWRSTTKPFIAAASVRAGAVDAFGLDARELAVMAASHAAEPGHIEAVLSILKKAGISPDALQCGGKPDALHNNCSGKHAGILALSKHIGAPLETYLEPDHPAQREILALCERAVGERISRERIAVDGCGIPVIATSLRRAALAFARFATLDDLDPADCDALARVRSVMIAHPWYVAGTDRFDTALLEATGGAVVGKGGAEGFHGDALVTRRAGLALKVADGNGRAVPPAVVAMLESLRALDVEACRKLDTFRTSPVRNVAGRVVGSIRAETISHPLV